MGHAVASPVTAHDGTCTDPEQAAWRTPITNMAPANSMGWTPFQHSAYKPLRPK
jgi:hypothetical protein